MANLGGLALFTGSVVLSATVRRGRRGYVHDMLRCCLSSSSANSKKQQQPSADDHQRQVTQKHHLTQLPHLQGKDVIAWQVGQPQPPPFSSSSSSLVSYDIADIQAAGGMYNLLISSIIPRPIALISSQSKDGLRNCAPFSYFNIMCHDPPLVCIGICTNGRQRLKKDTLRNIEETNEFVVNIMSSWFVESANYTCGNFPAEVDEMEVAGLATLPSDIIKSPRVADSAVQFECKMEYMNPIKNDKGEHTCTIVTARILKVHLQKDVLTEASKDTKAPVVDWTKLQAVGRLGGNSYTNVIESFDLLRPSGKLKK